MQKDNSSCMAASRTFTPDTAHSMSHLTQRPKVRLNNVSTEADRRRQTAVNVSLLKAVLMQCT